MNDKIIIVSKDAMCTGYLPLYGNKQWNTPNIDAIAEQGTVFLNHYTAAPSTVMSFYSMITGKFAHESGFDVYEKSYSVYKGETLFSKLRELGYDCHIIWAQNMMPLKEYLDYFRDDVTIHPIDVFRQGVGAHYLHSGFLVPDKQKEKEAYEFMTQAIAQIIDQPGKIFLWIHFPHVIKGQVSYGSDIELFDRYVGFIRTIVSDDSIVITADHGNMNGHKGKLCYGFDVYQPNIKVPLITPRIQQKKEVLTATSSVDLFQMIVERIIPERRYVYSDCAYRAQPNRKIAIIKDNYKYIYNKKTKTEELYDLSFDPLENFSIMKDYTFDTDRKINSPSRELYYYPKWDDLDCIREELHNEKERIWENGSLKTRAICKVKDILRPIYSHFIK